MDTNRIDQLKAAIIDSLDDGKPSNVTNDILSVSGYSGAMYKRFANRLLSKDIVKNYLEIGVFLGSTAISALHGNHKRLNYTVIDNFCLGKDVKQKFLANWKQFIDDEPNLIDADCFAISPKDNGISNIDVYFYDGEHKFNDHYLAMKHYHDAMADSFIFMVDDWSWKDVQSGTYKALNELGLKIMFKAETLGAEDRNGWWNGCGIFVLQKNV